MADLLFYINNQPSPPPDNWEELEIELNFTNNSPDASVRTTVFQWKGENAKVLNDWKKQGLLGTLGIWEGIPFRIEVGSPAIVCFDGCIDMTSQETTFTCDIVKASCVETNRVYFLNDTTEGFTFAYLANSSSIQTSAPGFVPIAKSDFIPIPYVIHSGQADYIEVALLSMSAFQMIILLKSAYEEIQNLTKQEVKAQVGAATGTDVSDTLAAVLYVAIIISYILYIVFLLGMLVALVDQLINNIIGSVKYKYGMKVAVLFQKACDYLGLGFSSTILLQAPYNDLVLMPSKRGYTNDKTFFDSFFSNTLYPRRQYDDTKNANNAYGYYEGTFKQLIMDMEQVFNAKVMIRNNVLSFERWDFWNNKAQFVMPPQSSDAPFDDQFGTNASEIASNYEVLYQLDSSDYNTYNNYEGTSSQMILHSNIVNIRKNVLLKRLNQVTLPFSLAKRKNDYTVRERLIQTILLIMFAPYNLVVNITDVAMNTYGGKTPLPPIPKFLTKRIGMMTLSRDFTSVPKLMVLTTGNNIHANNSTVTGTGYTDANTLNTNFHSASWAVNTLVSPVQYPNQYLTFTDKKIPLCNSDFVILRNNNIIKSIDQKDGRVDSIKWNPHFETALIDFRVKEPYSKNLNQTIIIDGKN